MRSSWSKNWPLLYSRCEHGVNRERAWKKAKLMAGPAHCARSRHGVGSCSWGQNYNRVSAHSRGGGGSSCMQRRDSVYHGQGIRQSLGPGRWSRPEEQSFVRESGHLSLNYRKRKKQKHSAAGTGALRHAGGEISRSRQGRFPEIATA
ncbi:hypothetical protein MPH_11006 [Macrophomina phaseolina MS6]|uniref:Uncharacterized protein n=1 Tax=Macrophomina phaseolina (strain MS6) TaxID=1126212 RepID=K2RNT6_MACPH|nr:hypothetical protein MPH_11006 [Macrophomina phaseolina MS6]